MKHYIIVKFKEDFNYREHIADITGIFKETLIIPGINAAQVKTSNSSRPNRWHIMIEINMDKGALEAYDTSAPHHLWKDKYGAYIESKAIFDCEDE